MTISTRRIELYLNTGHFGNASQISNAYHDSRGPLDPPFGERTITVTLNPVTAGEQSVTVIRDFRGLRLVFEDEVPRSLLGLFKREELGKVVITDLVPDGYGPRLRPCAGFEGPYEGKQPESCAWRVTAVPYYGQVVYEIIIYATSLSRAIQLLENIRRGQYAGEWILDPWRVVGLA